MKNKKAVAVAAGMSIDDSVFERELGRVLGQVAGRFRHPASRERAGEMVRGLVAEVGSKNCWTLAERAGHGTPDKFQYLLERAVFDHQGAVADLRGLVCGRLADPDAVLVVDETGDVKKGTGTVGVQRQYTGTAGRIENAQVAVYLTYASRGGHTLIDRRLYLPQSWTSDPARMAAAGVPDHVEFATKPQQAADMITDALDAGVRARWVAGDEVYGAGAHLRQRCRSRAIGYVFAVAANRTVPTRWGSLRVDHVLTHVPDRAWLAASAGNGTKGQRWYQWAVVDLEPEPDGPDYGSGWHMLLIRRNTATGEIAWYRCWSPTRTPARDLVRVAGRRWTVEENFQTSKALTALDQHQVRTWTSWHRWTLLVMLAHAFLLLATHAARNLEKTPPDQVRLSLAEVRRLINTLWHHARDLTHTLAWSRWRRRHQHHAQQAHYLKRGDKPPGHNPLLRL